MTENVTADQQSQRKITYQECQKCKAKGKPGMLITFEKIGENPQTGRGLWKLVNPDGTEHEGSHKSDTPSTTYKRNVWAVRAVKSGTQEQVNNWLEEGKTRKDGYFDLLGTGYNSDEGPERRFDLVWKEKLDS